MPSHSCTQHTLAEPTPPAADACCGCFGAGGTLVNAAASEVRLRCPNCGTRFLNISPDKLQLGTTVLLERQQQGARQQQQQEVGQASLNSNSATCTPGLGGKRTAVAVRDGQHGQPSVDPVSDSMYSKSGTTPTSSGSGSSMTGGRSSSRTAAESELPMWPVVTDTDVFELVSQSLGIPAHQLASGAQLPGQSSSSTAAQQLQFDQLLTSLETAVVGQPQAVAAVAGAMRLLQLGLSPPDRPSCSLMFVGPDGVGKTTLAKALAAALLPHEPAAALHLSMGEFSERHSIARLVGAPPGYVGYGKGGLLTEAIRRRPHSVVVLDDIDRAHPEVVGLLLQALDSGQMMDAMGHLVSLRSTVLLFTATQQSSSTSGASQHGSAQQQQVGGQSLSTGRGGVMQQDKQQQNHHNHRQQAAYSTFSYGSEGAGMSDDEDVNTRPSPAAAQGAGGTATNSRSAEEPVGPSSAAGGGSGSSNSSRGGWSVTMSELASRVDDVITFKPLSPTAVLQIVERQLEEAAELAAQHGVALEVDDSARQALAAAGWDPVRGARRVQKLVRQHVLVPLAEALLQLPAADEQPGPGRAAGSAYGVDRSTQQQQQEVLHEELDQQQQMRGLPWVARFSEAAPGAGDSGLQLSLVFEGMQPTTGATMPAAT